ncbi:MAG: 1-acyl-sn-glycerol-3-phosphate acyltransferase [Candidatus Lindowbacteria bacterium]|nr:1-acyl-sn-glycerol-3-phosphate acyltransferase [Candidatus Lindowbacteria bacterium]
MSGASDPSNAFGRVQEFVAELLYRLLKIAVSPIVRSYFGLRVEGAENIPLKGGFICAANHASFLDIFVIGTCTSQRLFFFIKDKYYRMSWLHWFFKLMGCIEIKSQGPNYSALRKGAGYLRQNRVLHIFPEGTRSGSGELKQFHKGVAFLSVHTGVPILPVYLHGTHEALGRHSWIPKPSPIACCIAAPLSPAGRSIDEVNSSLEEAIKELEQRCVQIQGGHLDSL